MLGNTVVLKNGSEHHGGLVSATMNALGLLSTQEPIVFYELVAKCRNRDHTLWGGTKAKLQNFGLLEEDGNPHNAVRDIVLSAIEGEDLDMRLLSPVKGK